MMLKREPEDFIVEEIPVGEWTGNDEPRGRYSIYKLKKTNLNTEEAVSIISRKFNINNKEIKYAGAKDKHAVTTQYISIPKYHKLGNFEDERLSLIHTGYSEEPLSLGTLKGNRFTITAREISESEYKNFKSKSRKFTVPNYFDEQRFSKNNVDIGLNILKKDFKHACESLLISDGNYENDARVHLAARPNDYIGALHKAPIKTLLMFIHAVQSYIFNEAICRMLIENAEKNGIKYETLNMGNFRLVFYTDIVDYEKIDVESLNLAGFNIKIDHHSMDVLKEFGLTERDFIVKAIPELTVEGISREIFINTEVESEVLGDRAIIEFELSKGSYATIVMKGLFLV